MFLNQKVIPLLKEFGEKQKCDWKILYAILYCESEGQGFYRNGAIKSRFEQSWFNRKSKDLKDRTELNAQSTSWGIAQIMGFHFALMGYPDALSMVLDWNDKEKGEQRQVKSFLVFIEKYMKGKLLHAIRGRDFQRIATYYNGKGYKANKYDSKLSSYTTLLS